MEIDNKPYHCDMLNIELAVKLADMGMATNQCKGALRDIAAVGAVISNAGAISRRDMSAISKACTLLSESGVPIHPFPRLHIYNLLPPVSSDFLLTAFADDYGDEKETRFPKADLAVICDVYADSADRSSIDYLHPLQWNGYDDFSEMYQDLDRRFDRDRLTAVSNAQDVENIWARSAHASGAKFVATYGGDYDEICSRHFHQAGHFETLIGSEEDYDRTSENRSYNKFGFLVREGCREQFSAAANDNVLLGQRLQNASICPPPPPPRHNGR